jgi:hypothetical protein
MKRGNLSMVKRFWTVDSIRNHLLAAQRRTNNSLPASLVVEGNGYMGVYRAGGEAVIDYLSQRFGINLTAEKGSTGPLSLKAWNSEQIKNILHDSWPVLRLDLPWLSLQDAKVKVYNKGITDTLQALAHSFGLEEFHLPPPVDSL